MNNFPNNDTLKKIPETWQGNLCDSCQRGGEEEEAKQLCFMCKDKLCNMCAKCYTHAEEIIKYYCRDHSVPCCKACIFTAHSKCDKIETVTETAKLFRKTEHNKLSLAMADLERTPIKQELAKNGSNIEETFDTLSASAEELYTKTLKHIQTIRNEYLNQLSEKTKVCKIELQENAESIEDKFLPEICRKSLNDLKEETKDDQYVREFHETNKKYTMLRDLYSKDKFCLKLVGLKSIPIAQDIERTIYCCDVNVVTIKKNSFRRKHAG